MPKSSRSNVWWILLIFAAVAGLTMWPKNSHSQIPWQTNYAQAAKQARAEHKLILLDFYADWCGPCQAMAADTWSDQAVADAVSSDLPVHINIDDDPILARHFGVDRIPDVVIVDGDGNIFAQHAGEMGPEAFLKWLHHGQTSY